MNRIFLAYSYRDDDLRYIIKNLYEYFDDVNVKLFSMDSILHNDFNMFQSVTDIIDTCNIIICFMDRDNPNIMFELGYALGKNKKIILVGDYNEIPYDMKQLTFVRKSNDISDILLSIEKSLDYSNINNYNTRANYNIRELFEKSLEETSYLDNISPRDFEQIIYDWLCYNGVTVERPMQNRDIGCDLILYTPSGRKVLVEVKKYRHTSKLSISVLRQLIGMMAIENIDVGIIINTGQYTNSILHYVKEIEQTVCLWDIKNLINIDKSIEDLEKRIRF